MRHTALPLVLNALIAINLLLLSARTDSAAIGDQIARCPPYQVYFQKILGYRPDFQLIGNTHELYPSVTDSTSTVAPAGNDINATAVHHSLRLQHQRRLERRDAINMNCWQRCRDDAECSGYVLFLNVSQCFGVTQHNRSSRFYTPMWSDGLLLDTNAVYFEKICQNNVPTEYRNKLWLFTKIPGTSLVQQTRKTVAVLVTPQRCAEQCILEKEFVCLSSTFVASHRNNLVRSEAAVLPEASLVLGTCMLSARDKSTAPDAFRVSTSDEVYIENQCAARPLEADTCAYEAYPHSRLSYADVAYTGLAKGQCTAKCASEQRFYCQGISYGWVAGVTRCLLHSEDVISLGPRALLSDRDFVYERRVKCLNVSVMCTRSLMTIRYNPVDPFNGRIYVNGHSDECTSKGKEDEAAMLRISIGNEDREQRCGVLRAYQIDASTHTNRTLLTTLVVVQMNAIVQTQADRLVKVGCIIDNNVHADGQIDDVSLASSLGFAPPAGGKPSTEGGTPLFNTTGTAPRVAMRIVDLASVAAAASSSAANNPTSATTTDVALGQNLELQITLEPADSPYDIRAMNMIARSDTGHSSILLLDPQGCATDPAVFPRMQRRTVDGVRVLYARFHAFKFAGSVNVNFDVTIRFCRNACEEQHCLAAAPEKAKARAKRDIKYGEPIKVIAGGVQQRPALMSEAPPQMVAGVDDVHQQNITERNQIRVDSNEVISQRVLANIADEIRAADVRHASASDGGRRVLSSVTAEKAPVLADVPLRLQLSVRMPEAPANSDSLIYGESGESIVTAGVPDTSGGGGGGGNYMCINRTFVILLLVLWLLLQTILIAVCSIVIRRYKRLAEADEDQRALERAAAENFGFGDVHRRVRWADQGRSRVLMYT